MNSKIAKVLLGIFIVVALAGLALGGLWFYQVKFTKPQTEEVLVEKDFAKIGMRFFILGIYPEPKDEASDSATMVVNSQIFEPLVTLDNNFKLQPVLAESWSSPDELTWRIKLKKNAKFHNGYSLTASDVKFSFDTAKQEKWHYSEYLAPIDKVEVVDNYTVDIKTKEPYPLLLNRIVGNFILSEKYEKEKGASNKSVGTGPFKLTEFEEGKKLVIERNENYHGKKPMVKKAEYIALEDDDKLVQSLKDGEVDVIDYIPFAKLEEVKNISGVYAKNFPWYVVYYLAFDHKRDKTPYANTEKNPFKDIRVRKAFYHAINVDELIKESRKGYAKPVSQMIDSSIFGYNSEIERLSYNPDKAKELLAEADYPNGFELTFDVPESRKEDGEVIKSQLDKIGIKTKLNVLPINDTYWEKIFTNKDFSLTQLGWGADSGDASEVFENLFHTPGDIYGVSNAGNYSNSKIDELVEKSLKTLDQTKRKQYLQEMGKIVMDDVAAIPLIIRDGFLAAKTGFEVNYDKAEIVKAVNISGKETVQKPKKFLFWEIK